MFRTWLSRIMSVIILIGSFFGINIGKTAPTDMITYNRKKTEVTIALESNPSTGYDWTYEISDASVIRNTDSRFYDGNRGSTVGAPGTRAVTFKGLKAGTATVTFRYLRPWEEEEPLRTVVIEITVASNKKLTAEETTVEEETSLDVTELSTAEIVEKFNKAAKEAKASSKSIKQNYCENTQVTPLGVNNAVLNPIANKLIESNMGRDKNKESVVYTSNADKVKNFPVSGQSWASKLTANDVKSATITKNGDVSTIIIEVEDDMTPNTGTYTGKAFSLVTKQQIVDGAGSAGMAFIKEETIALTYKNAVIKAKIDEKTGRLISANYYIQWGLALSTKVVPLDVSMYFGIEEDYTVNW